MRTIDGELNNLEFGQDQFGATGNEFPRLTGETYNNELDEAGFPLGPPPAPVVTNTDYAQSNGSPSGGNVVDSDPRTISNLLVDISLSNPAAVARAEYDPLTYDAGP